MTRNNNAVAQVTFSKWLAILWSALTLILTVLNALCAHQTPGSQDELNKQEAALKDRKAELQHQLEQAKLALDSEKQRIARYGFVSGLMGGVLGRKEARREALTVNVIRLALCARHPIVATDSTASCAYSGRSGRSFRFDLGMNSGASGHVIGA